MNISLSKLSSDRMTLLAVKMSCLWRKRRSTAALKGMVANVVLDEEVDQHLLTKEGSVTVSQNLIGRLIRSKGVVRLSYL